MNNAQEPVLHHFSTVFHIQGQAHDMFSRIFPNTNLQFFLTNNHVCNICLYFSQMIKIETKCLFFTNKEFLFQLRNIGEKIRRFVFEKFVKTCRELNKRCPSCLQLCS